MARGNRGPRVGSADRTGLGLGLAFSRQAVEANDGHISARNLSRHEGCVFTVNLPRLPMSVMGTAGSFDTP